MGVSKSMKKFCPRCKQNKPTSAFPKNASKKDGFASHCCDCKALFQGEWYRSHKQEHYQRNINKRRELRQKLDDFLVGRKCIDCGNPNPIVLEFDHVKGNKRDNVARLVNNAVSWESILAEIAKCEIRCANCHRIVTVARRNGS